MRTILIFVANPFTNKNIIHSGVLDHLLADKNISVILLVPHFKYEYFREHFSSHGRVHIESIPEGVMSNKLDYIYQLITQNSLPTTTVRIKQYNRFLGGSLRGVFWRILPFLMKRAMWWLGKISWWKKLIGSLYALFSPRSFKELFDKHQIDTVYLPTLLYCVDIRLMLEARRRSILSIGSILSWDNLTAKLLLTFLPDVIAVPNKVIRDDLIRYDEAKPECIHVVGYPQYDRYFNKEGSSSREDFCKRVGLDPSKKYILYAMAGVSNMPYDADVLSVIDKEIESGRLGDVQVLIRPYPKQLFQEYKEKKFAQKPHFAFDTFPASVIGGKKWEMTEEDSKHLADSIYHSSLVTSAGSTILVEGAVLGRPIVHIAFDGLSRKTDLMNRYQPVFSSLRYDHIHYLIQEKALVYATDRDTYVELLEMYLKNPETDAEKGKHLREITCSGMCGESARHLAKLLRDVTISE